MFCFMGMLLTPCPKVFWKKAVVLSLCLNKREHYWFVELVMQYALRQEFCW